jgi:membrane-anchored mycosin MYCP
VAIVAGASVQLRRAYRASPELPDEPATGVVDVVDPSGP